MSVPSESLSIAQFAIRLDGTALDSAVAWQIQSITVEQSVELPGMFALELCGSDDWGAVTGWMDGDEPFGVGGEIEVSAGYSGTSLQPLMLGEITALESEFGANGPPRLTVRGYDLRHRLQRGRKIRTFSKMKDSAIASKIAQEAGLAAEAVDSKVDHEYLIQANQTDFEFLMDRARQINYEVLVRNKRLYFRPVANDAKPNLSLSMANDSLSEFRARLSTSGQVSQTSVRGWDVKQKKEIVSAQGSQTSAMGRTGGAALVKKFGSARELVVTQPITSLAEADQLALAYFNQLALPLVRGEGTCPGCPKLQAGNVIEIKDVGKRFSGPYYVMTASHRYEHDSGYSTHFTVQRNAI
jgi:phage protein D